MMDQASAAPAAAAAPGEIDLRTYRPTEEEVRIIERGGRRAVMAGLTTALTTFAIASFVVPRLVPVRSRWMHAGNALFGASMGYIEFKSEINKGREELMNLPDSQLGAFLRAHSRRSPDAVPQPQQSHNRPLPASTRYNPSTAPHSSTSSSSATAEDGEVDAGKDLSEELVRVDDAHTAPSSFTSASRYNNEPSESSSSLSSSLRSRRDISPPEDQPDAIVSAVPGLSSDRIFNYDPSEPRKKKMTWEDIREAHRVKAGHPTQVAAHQTVSPNPVSTYTHATHETKAAESSNRYSSTSTTPPKDAKKLNKYGDEYS
eukprot:m.168169 g.168169  ORF g.168169 m.168169 type:complete len:316 (+) comp17209_c0_seq2:116-1063(+)